MGSGFRTFQSGEVLTASNVQNFLMEQSVMTFAGTAALGSAIGTAVEPGMVAYLTDSDQIIHYRADAVQGTAWQAMPMVGGAANVVINGAMQVAQRGTSVTGNTVGGYLTADRWQTNTSASFGTWTETVENDAPTGSGLRKSLKRLCTTAQASPAVSAEQQFRTKLEGQNLQQFLKGTASAKQFSLSFWVKSNVTGTWIVELEDQDNSRNVSASYTISASGTWEKKTIVFPADTTGAFDNDNASSLTVMWWQGAGTNFTSGTLATTWISPTSANRAVGQTNLAAATNNYWQITGVQLEAGSVATPFEFEDYGTTLRKCQRYFYLFTSGINGLPGFCDTTTVARSYIVYPTTMRGTPTFTATASDFEVRRAGPASSAGTSITANLGADGAAVDLTVASGLTAGAGIGIAASSGTKTMQFNAEL